MPVRPPVLTPVGRRVGAADRTPQLRTGGRRDAPAGGTGTAADRNMPWFATAGVLAGHRGPPGRAALRGLLATAGTAGRAAARRRPDGTGPAVAAVSDRRRLPLLVVPPGTLNHVARVGVGGLAEPGALATDGEVVEESGRYAFRVATRPVPVCRRSGEGHR